MAFLVWRVSELLCTLSSAEPWGMRISDISSLWRNQHFATFEVSIVAKMPFPTQKAMSLVGRTLLYIHQDNLEGPQWGPSKTLMRYDLLPKLIMDAYCNG